MCPEEGCCTCQFLLLRQEEEQGPQDRARAGRVETRKLTQRAVAPPGLAAGCHSSLWDGDLDSTLLLLSTHESKHFPPQGALTEGCLSPSRSAVDGGRFHIFFRKHLYPAFLYSRCEQLMETQLFIWGPLEVREAANGHWKAELLLVGDSFLKTQVQCDSTV